MITDIIIALTLQEFLLFIWLPIFLILLSISIIIISSYIIKKKKRKILMLNAEKMNAMKQKLLKERLEKILKEYDDLVSKKDFKKSVLFSYNEIRNVMAEYLEIKVPDYLTEREVLNEYMKNPKYYFDAKLLFNLYNLYEKVRFGEKDCQEKEIEEYTSFLKNLIQRMLTSYATS